MHDFASERGSDVRRLIGINVEFKNRATEEPRGYFNLSGQRQNIPISEACRERF